MSRTQILSIGVDKVTMAEALERCLAFTRGTEPRIVITPNAEITYNAEKNPELARVINEADLVIADGIGVVAASRILGDPVPEKVAGAELATRLVERLAERGGRIYLLGGKPGIAEAGARRLQARFPGITVAGFHHGYYRPEEEAAIVAEIRAARVDALFVGLGSPRQEYWMDQYRHAANARVSLGIGGTLDLWAGKASRGPLWMQRAGLEWLYRIVKYGRYGRSLPPLAKFVLRVFARRLRGG